MKHIPQRLLFENMRIIVGIFCLIAVVQAGLLRTNFSGRIIEGKDAAPGEIPYQVSLQLIAYYLHICGGSIVNEKYVVTGARCMIGYSASKIKVVAATINLNNPQLTYKVSQIIMHQHYDDQNQPWVNDIALIKVDMNFIETEFLKFVKLPYPNLEVLENSVAHVSGWGQIWESGPDSDVLQKTEVIIVNQNDCKNAYKTVEMKIYDTNICAFDPTRPTGPCDDDYGGPLTINGTLVGIVSIIDGVNCASMKYPGVYTRVTAFVDWINKNSV